MANKEQARAMGMDKGGIEMSTREMIEKQPAGRTMKEHISMNIRKIDNGFVLSINKDGPDGYESVELAITSMPKLLKAIATFLKEAEGEKEE